VRCDDSTPQRSVPYPTQRFMFPMRAKERQEARLTFSIQPVNPLSETGWDALVMTHPAYTFFHGSAWAKVLHKSYGFKPAYLVVRDRNCLLAMLPIMEVDSWFRGRRGVSLPFTDECPPMTSAAISWHALLSQAMGYGTDRHWKYLEWRGDGNHVGPGMESPAAVPSLSFYGHVLDLEPGEDGLFQRFDGSVRRAIRKAQDAGVKGEISQDMASIREFYLLHCQTRRKHGLPPQPFSFFRNIHDTILSDNQGFVSLARYQDKPIAASIFFYLGKKAVYKFGASDERHQQLRGNNMAMWEAIKRLIRNGLEVLHMGRTSLANEGLRRFKLGWATQECRMEYFRYDFLTSKLAAVRDEVFGWHNRLFRIMPTCLSRLLGTLLYRHMA
jgi:hypothetical protein